MASYNFTIRATDNVGAYADRTFSLNVNNTIYDRFVAVHSTGLSRSPDGINWTLESGLTGTGVAYGGGKWLVWHQVVPTLRSSPDGTSWNSYTPTFTGYTGTWAGTYQVKYRNGAWTAFTASTTNLIEEWTSADAITWTRVAVIGTYNVALGYNVGDFDWDAAGNIVVYMNFGTTFAIYYRAAAATFYTNATPPSPANYYSASYTVGGNVRYYNGLWIVQPMSGNAIFTSVDPAGSNWTVRTTIAQTGLIYLNGRILSLPVQAAAATNKLLESTNAARSFIVRTGSTAGTLPGFNNNYARQPLCYFGGTLIAAGPAGTNLVYRSVDDGLSYITQVVQGNGNIHAVAARDGIN